MNTSELEEILKKIDCAKNMFGGVYPSDFLPLEVKQCPQSFAANVDTSEKPGTHWMEFYSIDDQQGEFFDSYGLPPHRYTQYFKDFKEMQQQKCSSMDLRQEASGDFMWTCLWTLLYMLHLQSLSYS